MNRYARSFDDAFALQDSHLLETLSSVYAELYTRILETECSECESAYLLLAQLVLASKGFLLRILTLRF
jgi:hypothetical protein